MTDGERSLAAIMFTDIEGYSALSSRDEALALELLRAHWALLRPVFAAHKGREIKTIGDAFLIEYPSSLQAVRAGIAMQDALRTYNESAPAERRIRIRIGIHQGDVERIEGDLFGDGVNVASRVEPLSPPGGLAITEPVHQQVRNKVGQRFYALGPQTLKNIAYPVVVYTTDRAQRAKATLQKVPGATIAGLPIMGTLLQVLRNPARAALAVREGHTDLIGPWPLLIALASVGILMQQAMPLPGNSLSELFYLERMPPVIQVFESDRVDRAALETGIERIESVLNPIVLLIVAVFSAAGLRVIDDTRRFSQFVDTFVYAYCAVALLTLVLHPAFFLARRDGHDYQMVGGMLMYAYFLYAIWWLYWDRKGLAIAQSTMYFVTNFVGQFVAMAIAILILVLYVRSTNAELIGEHGSRDVYIAELSADDESVSVQRPWNLTKATAFHQNPAFSRDGRSVYLSIVTAKKDADLFVWDLRTGERRRVTESAGQDDTDAVELADGALMVLRDRALWRLRPGAEPERLTPAGEDVVHFAVAPSGKSFVVSGGEHRGLLFDLATGDMRLLPGATKLGHAVSWHPERGRFTVVRHDGAAAEIIAIDPLDGAIQKVVDLPHGESKGFHAWVSPTIAAWIDGSVVWAVRADGTVIEVVDLSEFGIRGASALTVDPQRTRIAFERNRNSTWGEYFGATAKAIRERG